MCIGANKNKILLTLYSSKTHDKNLNPQHIKITGIDQCSVNNAVRYKHRIFCPFMLVRKYVALRGNYLEESEQFFVFSDRTPVAQCHAQQLLKRLIKNVGLDNNLYSFHCFRIGRCSELIKLGYPIDIIQRLRRWRSNAVYKYIRN